MWAQMGGLIKFHKWHILSTAVKVTIVSVTASTVQRSEGVQCRVDVRVSWMLIYWYERVLRKKFPCHKVPEGCLFTFELLRCRPITLCEFFFQLENIIFKSIIAEISVFIIRTIKLELWCDLVSVNFDEIRIV